MSQKSPNKPLLIVVLFFTALSVISWMFLKPQGPHGGVIKKADNFFIEMTSPEKNLSAFLFDKKLKPVDADDIRGEVNFYFKDSSDFNMLLTRVVGNEFTCTPPLGYYSCKIKFSIMGKSVSANFSNPMQLVLKK